jgi:hypothetical protein
MAEARRLFRQVEQLNERLLELENLPHRALRKHRTVENNSDPRPVVVQGSAAPIVNCGPSGVLHCVNCGNVLAQGYEPRYLVALDIECFVCKAITRTPSWPRGEPFPRNPVTFAVGRYLMEKTVDATGGPVITCVQEIARVAAETGPRDVTHRVLDLSPSALAAFRQQLDLSSGGAFGKVIESTRRAMMHGDARLVEYPVAWACLHLEKSLKSGTLDSSTADGADAIAITYLLALDHAVSMWGHHPLFPAFVQALIYDFPHAITTLLTASSFAKQGNAIGFTDEATASGKSPDLFINLTAIKRVSIEVKTVKALHWPKRLPPLAQLESIVLAQLRAARNQITGSEGGVVVLGSLAGAQGSHELLMTAIESCIRRDKVSSRISDVVAFSLKGAGQSPAVEGGTGALINGHSNPRFNGAPILQTK